MSNIQRQDTNSSEMNETIITLNSFDMWALGITIVIGGQYFGWNPILTFGAGIGVMAACTVTIGYICLVYCVAELSSGLPFAGRAIR
jgi:ethanolamine permease